MNNKVVIGLLLVLVGAFIILSSSPNNPLSDFVDDVANPTGKVVTCDVSYDRDSIHSAICDVGSSCRPSGTLSFLGIDEDVTIKMLDGSRTVATEKADTDLWVNEATQVSGCFSGSSTKAYFKLYDESGTVVSTKEANI